MSNEEILQELQAIKKILILSNSDYLDEYLSKVITPLPRKKIWVNIDGENKQSDFVKIGKIGQSSVSEFLSILMMAGLIEYNSKKSPRRIIDYTPASWLEE